MIPYSWQYSYQRRPRMFVILPILIIIFIPIWVIWVAPQFKKLPSNFSYSADILSIDNFYDEKSKKYEGEHISKTNFSYKTIAITSKYNVIENIFDVRKMNDEPIFSVTRYYYIDPYAQTHVFVPEKSNRSGYLFAPRYFNTNNYTYWHINYNAPAPMIFHNHEILDGLLVYHYVAHYNSDQTENLHHLPGVPIERGIMTDITLQLWVEPISGWLIDYKDNTIAYYYDQKTKNILFPWNSFSNRYTQNSIHEQVMIAKWLRFKIIMVDVIVPIILILFAFLIYFSSFIHRFYIKLIVNVEKLYPDKSSSASSLNYIVTILSIIAVIATTYFIYYFTHTPNKFKIGISQWDDLPAHVETIRGFKDGLADYGYTDKNVEFVIKNPNANIENQIQIIQSFIRDKVDLIFTLTTPGTLVAKGISNKTPVVFTDVAYPSESNIISSSPSNNFVGTRTYIPPAEQFFYFDKLYPNSKLLGFAYHKGNPDSEQLLKEFKSLLAYRGISIVEIAFTDLDDVRKKIREKPSFNALYIACDTLMNTGGNKLLISYSLQYKIPTLSCDKESIISGALIGYIADPYSIGRLAGHKAALILLGATPSWLRTTVPYIGYLIINLKTANLLNIPVPDELQHKADLLVVTPRKDNL